MKGKDSQEKRTVSSAEWLVSVKFRIFGTLIMQSPNKSWFDDGTEKEDENAIVKQNEIPFHVFAYKISNNYP